MIICNIALQYAIVREQMVFDPKSFHFGGVAFLDFKDFGESEVFQELLTAFFFGCPIYFKAK